MEKNRFLFCSMLVVGIITAMVAMAEGMENQEIIFPEIAALAVGTVLAPKRCWSTSLWKMVLLIGICAVFGLLIVWYLPWQMPLQVVLAYTFAQFVLLYSKTTFAPMISAAILPVLMQTESIVYPISAIGFAFLIAMVELALEKWGVKQKEEVKKVENPDKAAISDGIFRLFIIGVFSWVAISAGKPFCIAPPILVAFTEFSRPHHRAKDTPVRTVFLIFLCSLAGAFSRFALCQKLHLPLWGAAFISAIFLILFMRSFKMFLPPAGALTVLAMIIPENQIFFYPFEVLAGMSLLMAVAIYAPTGLWRRQTLKEE